MSATVQIELTERELQIIRLLAEGDGKKQVGAKFNVSTSRGAQLISALYAKVGVDGRVGLVLWAVKHKLIEI